MKLVASNESCLDELAYKPSVRATKMFLNRELSWINFNHRVLREAYRIDLPILERVKFLAIVSSNIDEFYMKRLGGLKQQIGAGVTKLTIDGHSPSEQLELCRDMLLTLQVDKEVISKEILAELKTHKVEICKYSSLNDIERAELQIYYTNKVFPLLTPLAIDKSHPFPFISNLSLNLLVLLKREEGNGTFQARIKIPIEDGVPRFIQIGHDKRFICLEELVAQNVQALFPGAQVLSCDVFRVTRNAITDTDNTDVEDLRELIETELRDRKFAPIVRLQVGGGMDASLCRSLALQLKLNPKKDVFESGIIVRMSDFFEIADLDIPELRAVDHAPIDNPILVQSQSIFDNIKSQSSILLQHPYESFSTSVERLVLEASRDPYVASIKMTLYRTSADTKIIDYLIDASRQGKQVAVIVELKARFDEAANMNWASRLEEAGVHVSYGLDGLKTHCKTILVVRRESDGLRRYAHIGTGNYHAGTAKSYSDLGLLTCNHEITADLSELFNHLTTGCRSLGTLNKLLSAPETIKKALLRKIEREAKSHSESAPGFICLKTNALEDPDITRALYRASQAGVRIELIVRDICRLRPGIKGISDNIRVTSIVGRFLEHSRIYYFQNGGKEEYYIGSADLMTRNLERRVELLVPVDDPIPRKILSNFIKQQLDDNYCAWDMNSDGSYVRKDIGDNFESSNCQQQATRAADGIILFSQQR